MLLNKGARIIGQGITGSEGQRALEWAEDYETNFVAGVTPGKGGQEVQGIPIYNSVKEALEIIDQVDASVIFVPPRFAKEAAFEAIDAGIKFLVIIAEKVPTKDGALIYAKAKQNKVTVVGPNTVGIINPERKLKLGLIGGGDPEKMFVEGQIAVISKSGSMTAEISLGLKKAGMGVSWAVGIGGDRIIGVDFVDFLLEMEEDPATIASVIFGELGGTYEERVAEYVKKGLIRKPIVAFIGGEFTQKLPSEVQFGHAGAIIEGDRGKPEHKREVLRDVGVSVVDSLDDIQAALKEVINGKSS